MNQTKKQAHLMNGSKEKLKLEWKDKLALLIAVYRVFLPWAVCISILYTLVFVLFDWIF